MFTPSGQPLRTRWIYRYHKDITKVQNIDFSTVNAQVYEVVANTGSRLCNL